MSIPRTGRQNLNLTAILSLIVILILLSGCVAASTPLETEVPLPVEADRFEPATPECIAPANPGGGWDFGCRAIAQALNATGLLQNEMAITNMPGGGGSVAFGHVVNERYADNNLIVAASPSTTVRIAQAQYGNQTENDVRWLGAIAADFAVLAVAQESPIQSLDDLVAILATEPSSVAFGGGSAVGSQDHMKILILAISAGIDPLSINYTAFDGGGEALSALLEGFIDVFPGDASEVKADVEAGRVRVLATLTPKRLPSPFAQIPTTGELGYPAEWIIFRGYFAPDGLSPEAYNYWVGRLEQVARSPEWRQIRQDAGLGEFFMTGEAFEAYVKEQVQIFRQLSRDLGLID